MDIQLVGSGGCMWELAWQILRDNRDEYHWNIAGYVDSELTATGKDLEVNGYRIPYFGNDDALLHSTCN